MTVSVSWRPHRTVALLGFSLGPGLRCLYVDAPLLISPLEAVPTAAIAITSTNSSIFLSAIDWGASRIRRERMPDRAGVDALVYLAMGRTSGSAYSSRSVSPSRRYCVYRWRPTAGQRWTGRAVLLLFRRRRVLRRTSCRSPMLFSRWCGCWALSVFRTGSLRALVAGSSAAALAGLAKPVSLVLSHDSGLAGQRVAAFFRTVRCHRARLILANCLRLYCTRDDLLRDRLTFGIASDNDLSSIMPPDLSLSFQ